MYLGTQKWSEVKWSEVAQSCLTLCDSMDCSPSGSFVHGIFQAIVLEWIALSFSRGSSQPRDWTQVSRIVDRRFTIWATREVQSGSPREGTQRLSVASAKTLSMDNEDVVYIYNGILFNHKKEWNNPICSNMGGPGDCHTKWRIQAEKHKYISGRARFLMHSQPCRSSRGHFFLLLTFSSEVFSAWNTYTCTYTHTNTHTHSHLHAHPHLVSFWKINSTYQSSF